MTKENKATVAAAPKTRFNSELFTANTKEFLDKTSINGLHYLAREDFNPIEKVFFAISIVSSVIACSYFLLNVITKWNNTPTIMSISPVQTFIVDEPFPAVTICNLNQADKYKVKNFSPYSNEFAMLQMLCKRKVNDTIASSINDWSMLRDFIVNISQPCHRMLLNCSFAGTDYNCSELFHPIVSSEGLCCTFNMLDPKYLYVAGCVLTKSPYFYIFNTSYLDHSIKYPEHYKPVDWSLELGYSHPLPTHFIPIKSAGIGKSLGLKLILNVEMDKYYCSSSNSIGFKIALHKNSELPDMHEVGVLIPAGSETNVRIATEKIETHDRVRLINKRSRQCIFGDEMKLEVFRHYGMHSCQIECIANALADNCGCAAHQTPRKPSNLSICSIYQSQCMDRAVLLALNHTNGHNCFRQCWPSCFNKDFTIHQFSAKLIHWGFDTSNVALKNFSGNYLEKNIALLALYHSAHSYRSYIRSEFINAVDVLSSFGGLISSFTGLSFISLIEFVFYAIIRPFRQKRMSRVTAADGSTVNRTSKYVPQAVRAKNRMRILAEYMSNVAYAQNRKKLLAQKSAFQHSKQWQVKLQHQHELQ